MYVIRRVASGIIAQVLIPTEVGGNRLSFGQNMELTKLKSLAFVRKMLSDPRLTVWFSGGYIL